MKQQLAASPGRRRIPIRQRNQSVRPDEIVELERGAFIEAAVRPGGADEHAGVGEIDAQGILPGIDIFTLAVQLQLAADEHGHFLLVLAGKRLGDLGVAALGVGADEFLVLLCANPI